jgi:hypothetical protein
MKRLLVEIIVGVVLAFVVFMTGLEVGHRKGYDTAWMECKFDAKQQLFSTGNEAFWKWYGSNATHIRKHRSLFQ